MGEQELTARASESGEQDAAPQLAELVINGGEVDLEDGGDDDSQDMNAAGSDDDEAGEEGDDEGQQASEGGAGDDISQLREDLKRLQADNNRLGFALRENDRYKEEIKELRAKVEGKSKDGPVFTNEQLIGIAQKHGQDPNVMVQVVQEMVKNAKGEATQSAQEIAETNRRSQEMRQRVLGIYPQIYEPDNPIRSDVERMKEYANLEGHAHADELAIALLTLDGLPGLLKAERDKGRQEALGKKAETKRKGSAKATSLADTGERIRGNNQPASPKLTETAGQAIKSLNLTGAAKKRYLQMLQASKKTKGQFSVQI